MANVNRPNGFTPIGTLSGSPWSASVETFQLDATHAAIAVGDIVEMTADGYLDILTAGATDSGVVGVVVGVNPVGEGWNATTGTFGSNSLSATEPTLVGINSRSIPLNTAGTLLVCTAPDVVMVGQEDGDTTPLTLAAIGSNVDIIGGGPDATTGQSDMMIDSTSTGQVATDPFILLGLYDIPGNELASVDATLPWAKWKVTFANHARSGLAVGI
jgi:hypothetical protein